MFPFLMFCSTPPPFDGRFGNASGATTASCTGPCTAGYACVAGSTDAAAAVCPQGRYSLSGAASCSDCPPGLYGAETGMVSPACSGNCSGGYYCIAASRNATAAACPAGLYSTGGVATCSPCPPGRFGNVTAVAVPVCIGDCSAGYACPSGSVSPLQLTCPPGQYSLTGASNCTVCVAGQYGNNSALPTAACSGMCDAGSYGAAPGLTVSTCSGPCTAGYACPVGSTNATVAVCSPGTYSTAGSGGCTPCPAGQYGQAFALPSATCSGACTAGHYCPMESTAMVSGSR